MKEVVAMRKFVTPEIVFGVGSSLLAGQYVENFGVKRTLLVTDPGVLQLPWLIDVQDSLGQAGVEYIVFSGVSENPRDVEVMKGAQVYLENNCDCIVAIGGGSPMDCAKGIGVVITNKAHVLSFEGVDMINHPGPPLVCIPSTAGSSADVSQFAIITDTKRDVKVSIVSKTMVPDVALVDPGITVSMNSSLTASTGMDALTHAIEAYVSNANSALTDLLALDAVKLISENLVAAIKSPDDLELRGRIMLGSMQAGLAFSNAILGAVHAMAHSLGGYLDLPHGECNAILLPHVLKVNFPHAALRYRRIAETMRIQVEGVADEDVCSALVERLDSICKKAGMYKTLKDFGLSDDDLPGLASLALNDACMVTNPVELTQEDLERIYAAAL